MATLVRIGSLDDDRSRLDAELGRCNGSSSLIRSPLSLSAKTRSDEPVALWPTLDITWNSAIPASYNDGAMWAGRGLSATLMAGGRVDGRWYSVIVAPELITSRNGGSPIIAYGDTSRSVFASPFHGLPESADIPQRFGTQPFTQLSFGQSTIEAHTGSVGFGATTENQWWGPGIRNALVMSNNAAGIPQLYLRTTRPVSTPVGDVEARWLIGGLSESIYFDHVASNDQRSLSAAVATLRVAADTGLTIGLARAVYAPAHGGAVLGHFADVLTRWNQSRDTISVPASATEQIASLFFRWAVPSVGGEAYAEWARITTPASLRELIVDPQKGQGFTAGVQWAHAVTTDALVRVQGEFTTLEQTPPHATAATPSFYTSHIIPQGYTQRGQVIGAAIGPGSSSQLVAGDYITSGWQAGLQVGRVRWDEDMYYRQPTGFLYQNHDVSLFVGFRGAYRSPWGEVGADVTFTQRDNYLFQTPDPRTYSSAFDIHNTTIRMSFAPGLAR